MNKAFVIAALSSATLASVLPTEVPLVEDFNEEWFDNKIDHFNF